jgi:hypothetical protein
MAVINLIKQHFFCKPLFCPKKAACKALLLQDLYPQYRIDSPSLRFVSACSKSSNGYKIQTYEINSRTTKD